MNKRRLAGAALVLGCLILGGIVAVPDPSPDSGPRGLLALRRFLQRMGLEVKDAPNPPRAGSGTFFLPYDSRTGRGADQVLDWVASGGRLVLASPSSDIASHVGVKSSRRSEFFPRPGLALAAGCSPLTTGGVDEIVVSSASGYLTSSRRGSQSCFVESDGSHMLITTHGKGQVIVLSGSTALTNQFLSQKDNALLAYRLFEGFGPVVVGPPADPSLLGVQDPWDLLPDRAKSVLAGLVVALGIFALARGRRFGRPITEQTTSPIEASQLVWATAGLYQSAKARALAAQLLRRGAARRISRRLGIPGDADVSMVAAVAARELSQDMALLEEQPVADDADLIRLAQELEAVESKVGAL
jgi:hypothetical protein